MKYIYKDFVTGKLRYTKGKFIGWTKPTGPLNVPYAIFQRPKTNIFVPKYLLTSETITLVERAEK